MSCGLSETLHCLNINSEDTEMSMLERQSTRLKSQQQQLIQHQPFAYFDEREQFGGAFFGLNADQGLCDLVVNGAMKPVPGLGNGLNERFSNYGNGSEFQMSCALPRTVSCPPSMAAGMAKEAALRSSADVRDSSKKRKADRTQNLKVVAEEKSEEKKMKASAEDDPNVTEQNSSNKSTTTVTAAKTTSASRATNSKSTKTNKMSEAPKTDYIHVRARRGQATDSHSLAERVRREKISERMKLLQDLVPGCNKITGKAGMLDEIINYVQSLQRQVEFLSMKLAAINPRLDFEVGNYVAKEIFPACTSGFPTMANPQLSLGEGVANHMDMALRRTISAPPVSIPHAFLDSNQLQHLTWEDELQNLYSMEYQPGTSSTSFFT